MNIFKKIVDILDDGFIRLVTFCLFWGMFIIYSIINQNIELWNFIYYAILYIPLTILLLKKSFYYANILILVLSVVEILSSSAIIIQCALDFEIEYLFTIILSLFKFTLFVLFIIYIIIKLKNKELDKEKNNYIGFILSLVFIINIIIGVVNLILRVQTSSTVSVDVLGFMHNNILIFFEILFVITTNKEHMLIKKND